MADEPKVEIRKLTEFMPDPRNVNKGTSRGRGMIQRSLQENGAGRSLLASADGVVLAGNKTQEAAIDAGFDEVIVVHTDGKRPVIVQRDDLQAGTPQAARIALADNRTNEIDLDWDTDALKALADDVDLSGLWTPQELDILANIPPNVEFKEYDESVANDVEYIICPQCGYRWPK